MNEQPLTPEQQRTYDRRWKTLVVLCTSLAIVMVANSSLNVALPVLARDLDASTSSLQWIVDAYALVFAGMLFAAGALGDRFGRKGALQGGLVLFGAAAVMATMSDTAGQVIAARGLMGLGAAFVMPSTLSILTTVFPPHERAKAISLWAGIAAGGAALGAPISGFLLEHFWWGSIFLINIPLVVLALVAGSRLVPTSKDPDGHPIDLPGLVLSIGGVTALVYAIIEAPNHGWVSGHTLLAAAMAVVVLAGFAARELTARDPMLDLRLFGDARFGIASLGIGLGFFAMFGTMFLVAQYIQLVLGHSALEAGLILLPLSLAIMATAPRAPGLVARFGVTTVVPLGLLLVAAGLAMLSLLDTNSPVWAVYTAMGPMCVGMAVTMSPLTTLIMTSVPLGRAGMGSAMNDTTRELGGALGVAVLGSLVNTRYDHLLAPAVESLPEASRAEAASGLAGALKVAAELPGGAGAGLADTARSAFVSGLGVGALSAAGVACVAAALAWRKLPRTLPVQGGVAMAESPAASGADPLLT